MKEHKIYWAYEVLQAACSGIKLLKSYLSGSVMSGSFEGEACFDRVHDKAAR